MTNGGINVEIGNPSYNMYEVEHDNHADAGSLLRPNFTLDPHKVGNGVRDTNGSFQIFHPADGAELLGAGTVIMCLQALAQID